MAIVRCKVCKAPLSSHTRSCPHCSGKPERAVLPSHLDRDTVYSLIFCILLVALVLLVNNGDGSGSDGGWTGGGASPSSYSVSSGVRSSSGEAGSSRGSSSGGPSSLALRGEYVRLRVSSGEVALFPDKASYKEGGKLLLARDFLGLALMESRGEMMGVASGTRALVLEISLDTRRVRIMEGPYAGFAGWVPASICKPH